MNAKYDFLFVGAGLTNAILAYRAKEELNATCLVIDSRTELGGNCHTYDDNGIVVHKYGPHIFHTDNKKVWNFIGRFADFHEFRHRPKACVGGKLYDLPFSLSLYRQVWPDVKTEEDARAKIQSEIIPLAGEPRNLEERALSTIGRTLYEMFVKGYTEKQWGKPCTELPPSILARIPVRFDEDCDYFNEKYQGVPVDGYTPMFERLLDGIEVRLGEDFNAENRPYWERQAGTIFYSGSIDKFFGYSLGQLEYRSLRIVHKRFPFQGEIQKSAVVNYPGLNPDYTRSTEHSLFLPRNMRFAHGKTAIDYEYPTKYREGINDPMYPVPTAENIALYQKYEAMRPANVNFVGRLGKYKYANMDACVEFAMTFQL